MSYYVVYFKDGYSTGSHCRNDKEAVDFALAVADMRKTLVESVTNQRTKKVVLE